MNFVGVGFIIKIIGDFVDYIFIVGFFKIGDYDGFGIGFGFIVGFVK